MRKISTFQPKLAVNECHFGLLQLRAVMRIVHERVSSVKNAHC